MRTNTAITSNKALEKGSLGKMPIAAMAILDQPDLNFFGREVRDLENGELFDLTLLGAAKVMSSNVQELQSLVLESGIPDYPIIFCRAPGSVYGWVYLEGELNDPYVFLDATRCGSAERLRDIYIHEAAHLTSTGQEHDFTFAVIHNLFRAMADLRPSELDYDYRDCLSDFPTLQMAKEISIACASNACESGMEISMVRDLVKQLVDVSRNVGTPVEEIPDRFRELAHRFAMAR